MTAAVQHDIAERDTEDVKASGKRELMDLMRDAVDGSRNFMSRRAQQILWEQYGIAVVE